MKRLSPSPLSYKKGLLHFDNIPLTTIADKVKTPFYLYSEKTLIYNYEKFQKSASDAGITDPLICFAVKSNPNLSLLKRLAKMGAGADIVSGGELKRALEAGIPPQKIVFSGVGKTDEEILQALKCNKDGVYSFNVESLDELETINRIAKKRKQKARIAFRLNPAVEAKTHKHISTGGEKHKFGILGEDILKAIRSKKYWSHCKLVGLSIHIGSQLTCLKATKKAIKELAQYALEYGKPLEFLDIGGGLGVDYSKEDAKKLATLSQYMNVIKLEVQKNYLDKCSDEFPDPKIVFEPGRIISARTGTLVTKVIRTKTSKDHRFVIVDGAMNDFLRISMYGAYHDIYPQKKSSSLKPTDVVGPVCESADCFAKGRQLPSLKKGDILTIADTGAYGFSMASTYNLRELPGEVMITVKGKIRKA